MFTELQTNQLKQDLDQKHVKKRSGGGSKQLSYIEAWHAIAEANRIFGFDAWSRELIDLRFLEVHARKDGKSGFMAHYIATVRITVHHPEGLSKKIVRDGTGYGNSYAFTESEAHEVAAKEAESDAMKRALMTFGNPFGLALYDKTQAQVSSNVPDLEEKESPQEAPGTQQEPVQRVVASSGDKDLPVQVNLVKLSLVKQLLSATKEEWDAQMDSFAVVLGDSYWQASKEEAYLEFFKRVDRLKVQLDDDVWYRELVAAFEWKTRKDAQGKPRAMTLFHNILADQVLR